MKNLFLLTIIALSINLFSQESKLISTMDFIKIENKNDKGALYFLNNNWKKLRIEAVNRGYIKSFQFLEAINSSSNDIDIILLTVYKDLEEYKLREENFKKIMKDLLPNGPKFLNDKEKKAFMSTKFYLDTKSGCYNSQ